LNWTLPSHSVGNPVVVSGLNEDAGLNTSYPESFPSGVIGDPVVDLSPAGRAFGARVKTY